MDINGSQKNRINCLSLLILFFFASRSMKAEGGGSQRQRRQHLPARTAEQSEPPRFISGVSRPLSRFVLLINLLTPLYCVNWGWEPLQVGIAANNRCVQLSSKFRSFSFYDYSILTCIHFCLPGRTTFLTVFRFFLMV